MERLIGDRLSVLGPNDSSRINGFIGEDIQFHFDDDGRFLWGIITSVEATSEGVSVHCFYKENPNENFKLFFDRLRESQGTPDYHRWFLVEVNGDWLDEGRAGDLV